MVSKQHQTLDELKRNIIAAALMLATVMIAAFIVMVLM
jgi:hypothetical protein